ncbi:MAG: non-heme iron oxygenase ferredoxin subunit [Nitrososphaerales archaeon]
MVKLVVGKREDIPNGKMIHVEVGGKDILVANIEGNFYAMSDICTHAGANLHEGELEGKVLTCPWHGAKWDVTNGKLIAFPARIRDEESYKVTIENETVYVEV